jgi:hypothetical protein
VGHVVVDVLADGTRRPGGTVLYGALQAARLGLSARIVTRGVPAEVEDLLAPFAAELELQVERSAQTTTLEMIVEGAQRRQRVLAWAGPMELRSPPQSEIVHLAPVAAELGLSTSGWAVSSFGSALFDGERAGLLGLTPQGLVRRWSEQGAEIETGPAPPAAIDLARRCDAIVLSEQEHGGCQELVRVAAEAGAIVAITAGAGATTLLRDGEPALGVAVQALERPVDDLGAGDVYAAAFFVALGEGAEPTAAAAFASAAAAARMLGSGPAAVARRTAIEARLAS